jgi:hypothetical protein
MCTITPSIVLYVIVKWCGCDDGRTMNAPLGLVANSCSELARVACRKQRCE